MPMAGVVTLALVAATVLTARQLSVFDPEAAGSSEVAAIATESQSEGTADAESTASETESSKETGSTYLADVPEQPVEAWTRRGAFEERSYVTMSESDEGSLILLTMAAEAPLMQIASVDAETGETHWERDLTGNDPQSMRLLASAAGGFPVLATDIYDSSGASEVVVLDGESGDEVSRRTYEEVVAFDGGPIFVLEDGLVSRFDGADLNASPTWEARVNGGRLSVTDEGRLLVVGAQVLNVETGEPADVVIGSWDMAYSTYTVTGDLVVLELRYGDGYSYTDHVVLEADGTERWRLPYSGFHSVGVIQLASGEGALFELQYEAGVLRRLDPDTGAPLWAIQTDGGGDLRGGVGIDGQIVLQGNDGLVSLIDPADGSILGTMDGPEGSDLMASSSTYYSIKDEVLLAAWDGEGSELWNVRVTEPPAVVAFIADLPGRLITADTFGRVTSWN